MKAKKTSKRAVRRKKLMYNDEKLYEDSAGKIPYHQTTDSWQGLNRTTAPTDAYWKVKV